MSEKLTPGEARKKHARSFRQFWDAYPKHTAISEAERVFADLVENKGQDPAKLIESARNFAMSCDPDDLTYVPAAHSWLKQGRYDDVDLFADERAAQRNWMKQQWKTTNVKAVENRFGIKMPKQYPPDDMTDPEAIRFWHREISRAWITQIYRERVECQETESQPTTSEPSKV
ncbi:hypothetical protein [Mycobacteroides abscessus]|uniref:hypothetical protein n=1 Tax=Mycobacteroides abscessus TaxID=36809 RepID=UPI000925EE8F|nr:hypothetical protein [Mycobacteroides abscessus]WJJ55487.1 RepA-like replication initiator [Mycobacterium phage prophiT49-2]MDB2213893.1 hypothetical protein [Mycobacteroides abscessus subsp. massiliense]SHT12850.1 Uncharacterised protein [Mycobacteroides abscessus subsp. abscessus]SKO60930.1 Uncharacterised protein [Mycobacteroides abscessus subsp. abscessus]SLH91792.1 Uncharacterised protein [Mycobacteroides abscessus subsp. massiliense]